MGNAIVMYKGKAKINSWARWLSNRTMKKNQNNLVSIIGKTGSGKTLSAISICEMMTKIDRVPFGIDNIVFDLRSLMDLINCGKLKKGSKIIFDEPQVSISARDFQQEANKIFNYLLSTFRHKNFTLFFCTPFESLLDKNTRKLFHARFETMSIDRKKQTCRLKPRYIEYSDYKAEPYRKQMIISFKNEGEKRKSRKIFYWDVKRPSKELEDLYEEKKLDFTTKLNLKISERLRKFEDSGKSMTSEAKEDDNRKPLTEKQREAMITLANIQEGNKTERTAEILGIKISSVSKRRLGAEKKGYRVEEFKGND